MLNGSFHDNIFINRRGVTSLNWPKPKVKIDSRQGAVSDVWERLQPGAMHYHSLTLLLTPCQIFEVKPGMRVSEINLNR